MRFVTAAVLAMLPLATGCGVGTGDYVLYRIAFSESEPSSDCFPDGEDINDAEDTTTFRTGETFAIFPGADGAHFLEIGDSVIEGVKDAGTYSFSGQEVDVEYFGADDENHTTNTTSLTVTADPAGSKVNGTAQSSVTQDCTGPDCEDFQTFSCSGNAAFIGVRLSGVDLEHVL